MNDLDYIIDYLGVVKHHLIHREWITILQIQIGRGHPNPFWINRGICKVLYVFATDDIDSVR